MFLVDCSPRTSVHDEVYKYTINKALKNHKSIKLKY
jgi:hypothetical protein